MYLSRVPPRNNKLNKHIDQESRNLLKDTFNFYASQKGTLEYIQGSR